MGDRELEKIAIVVDVECGIEFRTADGPDGQWERWDGWSSASAGIPSSLE